MTPAIALVSLCAVGAIICVIFLIIWAITAGVDHYRDRLYALATQIAMENPDLLRLHFPEVRQLEVTATGPIELVIVDAELVEDDIRPVITFGEMEPAHAPLELGLRSVLENTRAELEKVRARAQRADRLRQRYLRKVRAVDQAFHDGADLFPVLHPYLARVAA